MSTVELTPDIDSSGVMVLLDGVESSHINLGNLTALDFEYMQQMQAVLRAVLTDSPTATDSPGGRDRALAVAHLGGAGCAMALAIHAEWPHSHQLVAEIDEILTQVVREYLPLPRAPHLRLRAQDAGETMSTASDGRFDVVIRDAFLGREVPDHLRTVEFTREVARALAPGGWYLANTAGPSPLTAPRHEVATVAEAFSHVAVIVEPGIARGRRGGNVVIVGGDRPVPGEVVRMLRVLPAPARLLQGADVAAFIGGHGPIYAPLSPGADQSGKHNAARGNHGPR